jgi:hypothetical protein
MCCLFSLAYSRLDQSLMASFPEMTNETTPTMGEPFVFPSYRNIGPPYIATLSFPGLTIGLSVWLFSTLVTPNATSASVVSTSPKNINLMLILRLLHLQVLLMFHLIRRVKDLKLVTWWIRRRRKIKKGSKLPTTARHVGQQPVIDNCPRSVDDSNITQTTCNPKYPCRLCKGIGLLKDFPGLSKVIEVWSTNLRQPMSSAFDHHANDLPSTSQNIVGKKKSRVKFLCMLCGRTHQTHIFPRMDEASKLLEDMIVYQRQLSITCHSLTLNPLFIDDMIHPVPSSVSLVDQVVNLVTSLVESVYKVFDLIPSLIDSTVPLESETQAVDMFPSVDPILPVENPTQVVDMISSSVDPTLPLDSKPNIAHVFLIDTESTVLGGIPPSPVEPPPSHEAILFYLGALNGPHLPSHIPFKITVQVCGQYVPSTLIDEGASISILYSIAWQALGYP